MTETGWNSYSLSDIFTLIGGGTPRTTNPDYWNGNIPWLSVADFNHGYRYVYSSEKTITPKAIEESSTTLLEKGQLIISARGTVGVIAQLGRDMAFNQSCYGIAAKENLTTNDFLYYLLNYEVRQLKQITHGGVFDTITRDTFDQISVDLPPLPTQHAIARILGSLDDKIELNRQMNETLEAMARAIFQSWFVDFDPVRAKTEGRQPAGMDAETAALFPDGFEEVDGREVPKGWRVGKVSDVVGINTSTITQDYPFSHIDYIEISSVSKGKFESSTSINRKEAPSRAQRLVGHGDTIWSGVRPNRESYLFIQNPKENLVVSTGFIVLSPQKIPPSYLYSWVTTEAFVDYLTANADGSTYPAVRADHFGDAEVLLPSQEILAEFEKILAPMRAQMHVNDEQSRTLAQIRDALLPKLMSREIKVSQVNGIIQETA